MRQRIIHTYDADGNELAQEWDTDADGTVETRYTYTYDADGNKLTEEVDKDADGTVEVCRTCTYDADGRKQTEEWDFSVDETVDIFCTYTHDANGYGFARECHLLNEEMELTEDMITILYSPTLSAAWRREPSEEVGMFGIGMVGVGMFGALGVAAFGTFGNIPIGNLTYAHDAEGNEISEEWNVYFSEEWDVLEGGPTAIRTTTMRRTTIYDAKGNRLKVEWDSNSLTGVESRTYTYDCWE